MIIETLQKFLSQHSYIHTHTLSLIRSHRKKRSRIYASASSSSSFHRQQYLSTTSSTRQTDIPLVFVPGLKGTHLSLPNASTNPTIQLNGNKNTWKKRVWLTLPNLLNFPPKSITDPYHDLSLPLTYCEINNIQNTGPLVADEVIDYILDLGPKNLKFFPFYAHVTDLLLHGSSNYNHYRRPTSSFAYDWRQDLLTSSQQLHQYCCTKYPNTPVQLLAHSMGGLLALHLLQKYPEKYKPGAVMVGVPFGTGVQYLQDLHLGYNTELGTCQQFSPETLFTFGSHWSFFPTMDALDDLMVDITDTDTKHLPNGFEFQAGKNTIGRIPSSFQPMSIPGEKLEIDFYNWNDWENNQFGIFDPLRSEKLGMERVSLYKEHLQIQLQRATEWRSQITSMPLPSYESIMPPLTICATDSIPTIHQILRRRRCDSLPSNTGGADPLKSNSSNLYEYDFSSGRSVPGDGRIDFDKAFPDAQNAFQYDYKYKEIRLTSPHVKQMCREDSGGNLEQIWDLVEEQIFNFEVNK